MKVAYLTFGPSHTVHLKKLSFKECSALHGQKGYLRRQFRRRYKYISVSKENRKMKGFLFLVRNEKREKEPTDNIMKYGLENVGEAGKDKM